MIEAWRPVAGFENAYEVSNRGKIRSLPRVVRRGNGKYTVNGRVLKPAEHVTGHRWVNLHAEGKRAKCYIHRAVAEAFIGECPTGKEVRHLDGDARNNSVENLAYGTRSENMLDRVAHGNHFQRNKTHCPRGHELVYANLIQSKFDRTGFRECGICAKERNST